MKIGMMINMIEDYIEKSGICGSVMYIQGRPGIGKSDIITGIGKKLGLYTKVAYMATMLTEQITGLPVIQIEENGNKRTVDWSIPELLNFGGHEEGILFVDDIHLADEDVQKYLFQLLIYKSIHEHTLPKGIRIILAGNGEEDFAGANPMLSPVQNRVFTINAEVDFDAWFKWAAEKRIHPTILSFLSGGGRQNYLLDEPQMGTPFSTPRSWSNLSEKITSLINLKAIKNGTDDAKSDNIVRLKEITAGHVTDRHATEFVEHVVYYSKFDPKIILSESFNMDNLGSPFEASACLFVATDYLISLEDAKKSTPNIRKNYIKLIHKFIANASFRPLIVYAMKSVCLTNDTIYKEIMEDTDISKILVKWLV